MKALGLFASVIFYFSTLVGTQAYARESGVVEGQLLSKSSTSRTVLLNVGQLDLVRSGDFVVLIRKTKSPLDDQERLLSVAKGRVIQAGKNRSIVMLYRVEDLKQIIVKEKYIVAVESVMMAGRRKLHSDRLTIVDNKRLLPKSVEEKRLGNKDTLALKRDEYRVGRKNHELGETYSRDGTLHDVDEWVRVGRDGKQKYARALWRSPYEKDFAIQKRLETFDKLVATYLARVNDSNFNYDKFYAEQKRDSSGEMKINNTSISEYESYLQDERNQQNREADLYREMLSKGEGWSDEYSDEELSNRLESVGFVIEQERRQTALVINRNWQLIGSVGLNLLDNENRADPDNSRKLKWNLEVGGEFFPAKRHDTFQQLGLWGTIRYMQDGVSVGNLNAQFDERSIGVGFNWHFLQAPWAVNRNIPFVGLGIRTGVGTLKIPTSNEEANYSMLSFPVAIAGMKYNLRSGWGLRLAASVEKLLLDQTENNVAGGDLPARTDFLDGRISIGFTKFY